MKYFWYKHRQDLYLDSLGALQRRVEFLPLFPGKISGEESPQVSAAEDKIKILPMFTWNWPILGKNVSDGSKWVFLQKWPKKSKISQSSFGTKWPKHFCPYERLINFRLWWAHFRQNWPVWPLYRPLCPETCHISMPPLYQYDFCDRNGIRI